jgi:hypothetical protein
MERWLYIVRINVKLHEGGWIVSRSGRVIPTEGAPSYCRLRYWVQPREGAEVVMKGKIYDPDGILTVTVHPEASTSVSPDKCWVFHVCVCVCMYMPEAGNRKIAIGILRH